MGALAMGRASLNLVMALETLRLHTFSLLFQPFPPFIHTCLTLIPTQDRWLQLAGEETGELRVRLAVVPGPPDSPAVTQMVALFAQTLHKATTATLQVCDGTSVRL